MSDTSYDTLLISGHLFSFFLFSFFRISKSVHYVIGPGDDLFFISFMFHSLVFTTDVSPRAFGGRHGRTSQKRVALAGFARRLGAGPSAC
jgi:hypothetical protein